MRRPIRENWQWIKDNVNGLRQGTAWGLSSRNTAMLRWGQAKKISRWRINMLTGLGRTLRLRSQQEGRGGECGVYRGKAITEHQHLISGR